MMTAANKDLAPIPMDTRLQREALDIAIKRIEAYRTTAEIAAVDAEKKGRKGQQVAELSKAAGHSDAIAVLYSVKRDLMVAEVEAIRASKKRRT